MTSNGIVFTNYKHKKQLNNCGSKVGMAGSKGTQTRVVGIITDKMHSTTLCSSNRVSMKKHVGMHLVCSLCGTHKLVYYSYMPTYCGNTKGNIELN